MSTLGTIASVLTWAAIVGLLRHELRAQRAEWAGVREFDEMRREMERPL